MKNKLIKLFLSIFLISDVYADTLNIKSKNIKIDKDKEISIFEDEVFLRTDENHTVESDYAEYNRIEGTIIFKKNIKIKDNKGNIVYADRANYNEKSKVFKTIGYTKIVTIENYTVETENIILNKIKNSISSESITKILDNNDDNVISLNNFEYLKENKIFKSVGNINFVDKFKNSYNFSQIYIDTEKKEILGSDLKAFLNDEQFKVDEKNNPRIFANTFSKKENLNTFDKSIFTLCGNRVSDGEDKCPPWTIQATKMLHDNKKKTIYYNNAIIKIYDIPIFYLPKLAHPDPSVERRSGFLPTSISDTKNLGSGITIPYFININKDKDFTVTNKLYADENPLFLGEYRQAFYNSNLIIDMGYTKGYKNVTNKKSAGDKSHFFTKFVKNFNLFSGSETSLSFQAQEVSNDKYLKLYQLESTLVDYKQDYLENNLKFENFNEDYFLSLDASIYESLKDSYNDKYEYTTPDIVFDTNILQNEKYGSVNFQSNFKINNYDTNKTKKLFINNFDWSSKNFNLKNGLQSKFLGNIKNVNYETKNILAFKEDQNTEVHGAFGYLSELEMYKVDSKTNSKSELTPKLLLRYAPGSMRKEESGSRLTPNNAFSMERINGESNMEKGLSATLGFDYKLTEADKEFSLSLGQIINKEENNKMASSTSLDEKLSDLVGVSNLKFNDNFKVGYNFSLDQNYNDLNYNELITNINYGKIDFKFNYLQEKKHIGNNEYFKTNLNYTTASNQKLSLENKRNLITNSSEYYDLSYEYFNDCLRAGLVFRREFYNDSELEPENSLMFKITIVPFGNIDGPTFNQ